MLLLFCIGFSEMPAQQAAEENYPVRLFSISSNDGLSQGFVPCIRQDKRGFIWFATKDGLNKYDGYKFTVYRHDAADPNSISDNLVTEIFEDSRGYLWVITPGKLDVFDPQTEKFYSVNYSPAGQQLEGSHFLCEDGFGNIWFFNRDEYFCMSVSQVNASGASFAEKFKCTTKPGSDLFSKLHLPAGVPHQLFFDGNGNMWLTLGDSLFEISKTDQLAGKTTHRYRQEDFCKLPGSKLFMIIPGKTKQSLYLLTSAGVVVYNSTTSKIEKTIAANIPAISYENASCVDESGNAWLNFSTGLHYLNYADGTILKAAPVNIPENTWASYTIEAVLVDHSGIVWMGTNGYSVFKFNPFVAKFHLSETGAMGWINGDNEGNIYFNSNGIRHFNPATQKAGDKAFTGGIFTLKLKAETITSPNNFVQDKDGIFWMAYGRGYLARYDKQKDAIRFYHTDEADSMKNSNTRVWLDYSGRPWIFQEDIARHYSIHCFDPVSEKFIASFLMPDKNPETDPVFIYCIVASPDGLFSLGTSKGLFCFDAVKNTWRHYENITGDKTSLSNSAVFSLCLDPKAPGRYLWVGTNSGGLNCLDLATNKFVSYTDKDGLPNNVIYGILSDNSGNLWLSTNRGLCRFNIASKECKNFYASDGLQSNEFNRYSYYKSEKGALYFGGVSGLNFFYPDALNRDVHPPDVRFTGIRLFNNEIIFSDSASPIRKPIDYLDEIVLDYNQNVITLQFSAMDFAAPEKNQFRYKLEGFDEDWTFSGTRNEAIYTGLAPGEYTFIVKASNSMGVWNEQGRSIRIVILPPWWQTWWARVLYIFAGIGLLLLFLWMRTATLRKNQKLLEEKVKERTQELKESVSFLKQTQDQLVQNEKLASFGQLTAGIAHEIKNPLNFINNFSELSNELIGELKDAKTEEERTEILEHLKSNLAKINHHGIRVDSIIKSMLQHSRSGGSVRQPTDINKLCEEYSNLAYHSMRANVPDFTCAIKKDLDPSLPPVMVIPQDISRVLLNFMNNAFYAVNERRKISGSYFRPELSISTRKENNMVIIRVHDNGSGIPDEVKRKLFTPFFTTKPTGEGTGLGLSISAEIIHAHGGTVKVESVLNEFTEFTILLPLKEAAKPQAVSSHSLN